MLFVALGKPVLMVKLVEGPHTAFGSQDGRALLHRTAQLGHSSRKWTSTEAK